MDGELYTITFDEQTEKGEKIPLRSSNENNLKNDGNRFANADSDNWEKRLAERQNNTAKIRSADDFYAKYGKPPSPSTKDILARQGTPQLPPLPSQTTKKSFYEMASEYAAETREKTDHVPFLCYWPSYEYMSRPQLDWYFYLRGRLRAGEYIEADLSYLFIYIYEIINQVGISGPDDGFGIMVGIWKNYRKTHDKLDRYLIDWAGDYINYYNCDLGKSFDLLEKEGLFLLMPADMLMEHYIKSDMATPLELIARFSDYKFYESEFIKGADGSLFTDHLPGLFDEIRRSMSGQGSGFEALFVPRGNIKHTKIPFLRAPFYNKTNTRLQVYPPYEQYKPLRVFVTAVVKEFENELRVLKKHKGRLRPDALPVEIVSICKNIAKQAVSVTKLEQAVEITIDRARLLALIQDSDEVRRRLIEGNYEYGEEEKSDKEVKEEMPLLIPELTENGFMSRLAPIQQKIIEYLLERGGSSKSGEIGAAFSGVFVGVEIDRINDAALESDEIGDLLIGFEDERWYIIEDYIEDLQV
jgi:hypothetical protein